MTDSDIIRDFAARASLARLDLIIAFRGWAMAANDFANGDAPEVALARVESAGWIPSRDCPDLPIFRAEFARRVRAACGA